MPYWIVVSQKGGSLGVRYATAMLASLCLLASACGSGGSAGPTGTPSSSISSTTTPLPPTSTTTPGETKIVFSSDVNDADPLGCSAGVCNYDLFIMNPDGTGVTQLTSDPDFQEISPSASPGGSRIVFNRFGAETNEVWVVNVDGSGVAKLIDRADVPALSRDGSKIAFEAYPGPMLSVANQDGSGAKVILDLDSAGLFGISAVAWAPDGTHIVFSAFTKFATARIYVVSADGSGLSEIVSGKDFLGGVSWSPDGKRIAYDDGSSIFLIDPDGKNQTKLIDKGSEPAWSSDGRFLAYRSARGAAKGFSIHTVQADANKDTVLTDDPVKIFGLCWTGA